MTSLTVIKNPNETFSFVKMSVCKTLPIKTTNEFTERIDMIHKTVKAFAVQKGISIRREANGYYYLIGNDCLSLRYYMSLYPTAKSGLQLLKREARR